MKKITRFNIIVLVLALLITLCAPISALAYTHDPMENPKAAQDIIVDPNAVYGYSPSPTSSRLKEYVDYDWSDPAFVAEMRKQREAYHESISELYTMISEMKAAGSDIKDIAVAVSTKRNEIRLASYKDDPEGLAKVKKSNLENYGNENGGTPEFFYEKYGSWETVIEKALSTNAGADACLGLYDKYYDTYFIAEVVTPSKQEVQPEVKPVAQQATDVAVPTTYTVVKGDSLNKIAGELLGDKAQWRVIYNLNKDKIKNPNLIYPGQVLNIK